MQYPCRTAHTVHVRASVKDQPRLATSCPQRCRRAAITFKVWAYKTTLAHVACLMCNVPAKGHSKVCGGQSPADRVRACMHEVSYVNLLSALAVFPEAVRSFALWIACIHLARCTQTSQR